MSKRTTVENALMAAQSGGVLPHGSATKIAKEVKLSKSRVLFIAKELGLTSGKGLPPRSLRPVYRVNAAVQCPECHRKMAPHGAALDTPGAWRFKCSKCRTTVTVDVPRNARALGSLLPELREFGEHGQALAAVIETGAAELIMDAARLLAGRAAGVRDPEMVELANHAAAAGLREECALLRVAQSREPAAIVAKLAALRLPVPA